MRAADRARAVYTAWNAVCSGTREGEHVTGLRFLSDQNKLLVYLDDAAWTQEFTMLREIIRARMERAGVSIDGFVFRTSKAGFKRDVPSRAVRPAPPHRDHPVQPAPLTEDEERSLDAAVAGIDDPRLRTSLKSAMRASLEWKKGRGAQNGS